MGFHRAFAWLGLCIASGGELLAAQQLPDPSGRVDSLFSQFTVPGSPGCAVGVSHDGKVVLARAYGLADLEREVPLTPATIFEAGSVSKQFTAGAVLLLALEGKLSLEDDIRKHFPELPDYGERITVRNLLNHTSGLRDWGAVATLGGWPRGTRFYTNQDALKIAARQRELNFTPGSEYLYSNTNYNLLALLVERVSAQSFAVFTRQRLFEPLGMSHTSWRDDYSRVVKGRALAYSPGPNGFRLNMFFENAHGNGGLLTTVEDLLRWNANFTSLVVGGTALVAEQERRGRLRNGRESPYASGLFVAEYRGTREVWHDGSTGGYNTFLTRFPERALSVAVLCNAGGRANPNGLAHQVADLFLQIPAPPAVAPALAAAELTLGADELARYVGLYRNTRTSEAALIELKDGKLVADTRTELATLSSTSFQARGSATRLAFMPRGAAARSGFQLLLATGDTIVFEPVDNPDTTKQALDEFAGGYRSDEADGTHTVSVEGNSIVLDDGVHTRGVLRAVYRDAFRFQGVTLRFARDRAGRIEGYGVWAERARNVRFIRIAAPR